MIVLRTTLRLLSILIAERLALRYRLLLILLLLLPILVKVLLLLSLFWMFHILNLAALNSILNSSDALY